MGCSVAAGEFHGPEKIPIVSVSPDLLVPCFHEDIMRPGLIGQFGEHEAVACFRGQRQAAPFLASSSIKFHKMFLGAQHHFGSLVIVPIEDLAGHVVMKFAASNFGIAPAPENLAIQFMGDDRAGVMNVLVVHVASADQFYLAILVEISGYHPSSRRGGIEWNSPPGFHHWDGWIRWTPMIHAEWNFSVIGLGYRLGMHSERLDQS
jgi:hypothetical protein